VTTTLNERHAARARHLPTVWATVFLAGVLVLGAGCGAPTATSTPTQPSVATPSPTTTTPTVDAQKVAAMTDYTAAVQKLTEALQEANIRLQSLEGQTYDHTDRSELSASISAAQAVLDSNSGMTAEDANTATDVQTATAAMVAAAATIKDPGETKLGDPLPEACATRGVGTNGCIDLSTLCPVQRDQLLQCKAVDPFNQLSAAYAAQFGHELYVDLAYRNYDAQVVMLQRYGSPRAATPGTSPHGLGLAIDLPDWEYPARYPPGYAAEIQYGTPQEDWLIANAPTYGWVFNVKSEPWHMKYTG